MSIISKIKNALTADIWEKVRVNFLTGADLNTMSTGASLSGNAALQFSAVFACCRVLSETFATIPVFEYMKKPDGDRIKTDDTGLYDLLHNTPNPEMSAFSAYEMAMYQINLGGNVVFTVSKNMLGEIVQLTPHQWQNVSISRDSNTKRLKYEIYDPTTTTTTTYRRDQVFHVAGPSLDGIVGMSPIEYAREAINLGKTYEIFTSRFYKNGAMPSGVFEHPGNLQDAAYARLKEQLDTNYTGLLNSGKAMLLEDGLKYAKFDLKLSDAELLTSKKFQIEDICRIYRVPLHLVQNLDKATNNNIEHQSLEFVMYTMLPIVKRWEAAINTQLLTREQRRTGYYFEYNISALLRGDSKSMAEAFAIGRQWGWMSVNDVRRLLNMNSIPNGDIYLTPLNMAEAGNETATINAENYKKLLDESYKLLDLSNRKGA